MENFHIFSEVLKRLIEKITENIVDQIERSSTSESDILSPSLRILRMIASFMISIAPFTAFLDIPKAWKNEVLAGDIQELPDEILIIPCVIAPNFAGAHNNKFILPYMKQQYLLSSLNLHQSIQHQHFLQSMEQEFPILEHRQLFSAQFAQSLQIFLVNQ